MATTANSMPSDTLSALATAKRMARGLDDIRAVDYGFAYDDGVRTERISIRFHMNRKRPLSGLPRDQRIPAKIGNIEVDVLQVGYAPHDGNARSAQSVLQPGISVGSVKLGTTGTLGAIVRDTTSQQLCVLSNWHVLCGGPEAAASDPVSQPGPIDQGGNAPREVAKLERWLRLSEQYDAAIARLDAGIETNGQLFGTSFRPTAVAAPELGARLIKSGAVSGVTHGIVDGIAGSYRLDYTGFGDGPQWMAGFRLIPDPQAPANALSLEGDSGSLWVDETGERAIGLHFAGEDDQSPLNDYALAHSIEDVFNRLYVSLAPS
jgi:hypothetical protein